MSLITEEQWKTFDEEGYVILEKNQVLSPECLKKLKDHIDAIMLGEAKVDYDKLMMQLDSDTGRYEDAKPQTLGWKGKTLRYRKIQNLEEDPVFLEYLRLPIFEEACRRVYGHHKPISAFRCMFMNKPAGGGTDLPWHQDRWQHLDMDPQLTVYTALDPATPENGCVQVIPRSHKLGLLNKAHHSGFLSKENIEEHCTPDKIKYMELEDGQVALLHNWVIHSSGTNSSSIARRAFSVNYMDGNTRIDMDVFTNHAHEKGTGYAQGADSFPLIFNAD